MFTSAETEKQILKSKEIIPTSIAFGRKMQFIGIIPNS